MRLVNMTVVSWGLVPRPGEELENLTVPERTTEGDLSFESFVKSPWL